MACNKIDEYNMAYLVEQALVSQLKPVVIENIIKSMIVEFRKEIEPIVIKEVEKVGIEGVEHFRDLARARDEIKIYCEWKG